MFDKEAEEYGTENYESCMYDDVKGWETDRKAREQGFKDGAEFGYNKANEWHKITDWKDNSQFPDDECKTYLVYLRQGDYFVCELDITEGYRQFYLTYNLDDIDPQNVTAWKEIVLPDLKESE